MAIDDAVRHLNSYNRSFKAAKQSALNITVFFDRQRITEQEGKLAAE